MAPFSTENLAGPCSFELSIPAPDKPVHAVWITYDRGYDISRYYLDSAVTTFAGSHKIALMLARQCPAKKPPTGEQGEMDMDPATGIGRSIFQALDNFARESRHAEISSSKLILLGFSGAGVLFANFVQYAPDRMIACILANPGQTEPYGMEHVNLPAAALRVPELIITGGADDRAGTQKPYDYFRRHRARGAPWVFLVQNGVPHCCVINAKALVLEWLDEVIKLRKPGPDTPLRAIDNTGGWSGFIRPCGGNRRDHWGEPLWNVCAAQVESTSVPDPDGQIAAAWFPTRKLGMEWLAFIREKNHPTDSFPDGGDAAHSHFAVH